MDSNTDRYIPASKWDQFHPWPSKSALRNLIFKSKRNGLEPAILRVGKRVLIREAAFFAWAGAQDGGQHD